MTIHLVEDDPAVCDSLMILLCHMGHQVSCYPDGESFLGAARPKVSDDIIVDLMLPGVSGIDVIKWLQGLEQPPRIIAMSGQPELTIKKQLRGISVAWLLRKPLTADDLVACLAGGRVDQAPAATAS